MRGKTGYPGLARWTGFAALLLLLAVLLGLYIQGLGDAGEALIAENGMIEAPQTIVLIGAIVLYALRFFRSADAVATVCITVIFILVFATVRETPRCSSPFYSGGPCLSEVAKTVIVGIALAAALLMAHRRRQNLREALRLRSLVPFWPLSIAVLMLVGAQWGEQIGNQGVEEALEFSAYLYAIAHAAWILRNK